VPAPERTKSSGTNSARRAPAALSHGFVAVLEELVRVGDSARAPSGVTHCIAWRLVKNDAICVAVP
jgi:hypothetical protein